MNQYGPTPESESFIINYKFMSKISERFMVFIRFYHTGFYRLSVVPSIKTFQGL